MSFERDMDQELRFHMQQAIDEYVKQGMTPASARERAMQEFGPVELAKDELRDTRPTQWLLDFWQDVRYAARGLRQKPGFALTAIAVLALGIGANTTVFTLLHRVLLASLPIPHPEQLIEVGCADLNEPADHVGCQFAYPAYKRLAEQKDLIKGSFAYAELANVNLGYEGSSGIAAGTRSTGDYFQVLGLKPVIGRLMTPDDDVPGANPVIVLHYGYWQGRFGADPGIVGKTMTINGNPRTIIGVAPPGFKGMDFDAVADFTIPLVASTAAREPGALQSRNNWWMRMAVRSDLSVDQLQARLDAPFRSMLDEMAEGQQARFQEVMRGRKLELLPGGSGFESELRRNLDRPLRILMAAVITVLLIACANLAGLLLSRASSRRREFAVRTALGAGRARIFRQLLAETLLLCALGLAGAVWIASQTSELLLDMAAGEGGLLAIETHFDGITLGFATATAILAALLIGCFPAWRLSRTPPQDALREIRGEKSSRGFMRVLIPVQVALTMVLVVGSALFLRTFDNYVKLDLGFSTDKLLTFRPMTDLVRYDEARRLAYLSTLKARLERLPGVVALTTSRESVGNVGNRTGVTIPGFVEKERYNITISRHVVTDRFVETTGLRLLVGRDFRNAEATAEPPVIVNAAFATHFFGGVNAVGKRFELDGPREIIGVVADAHERGPKGPMERIVYQYNPTPLPLSVITLRTQGPARALIPAVEGVLKEVDPAVPIRQMRTVEMLTSEKLQRERTLATLSAVFGMLALLLVGVGLYGLIAGSVSTRTREIGVRVALGAKPFSVAWFVTRESALLVGVGAAAGLGAGFYLSKMVEAQLFGVAGNDPLVYLLAGMALVVCAAFAAFVPARKAARVDPITALRCE